MFKKKWRQLGALLLVVVFTMNILWSNQFGLQAGLTIDPNKSIDLQVSVNDDEVEVGSSFIYTIKYTYSSTSSSFEDETIRVNFPEGMKFDVEAVTSDINGSPTIGSDYLTFNMVSPLLSGSTGVLKIKGWYGSGTLTETVEAALIEVQGGLGTDGQSAIVNAIVPPVKVTVDEDWTWGITKTKTYPTANPTTDAAVKYSIKVTGNQSVGGFPIENITVTDYLPEGAVFLSDQSTAGASVSGSTVTWDIGTINPGSYEYVTVAVKYMAPENKIGDQVTNRVEATGNRKGRDTEDTIEATEQITLAAREPGIKSIQKYSSHYSNNDDYGLHQTITYYIRYAGNSGNVALDEMTIIDILPIEIVLESVTKGSNNGVDGTLYYTTVTTDAALYYELEHDSWSEWSDSTSTTELGGDVPKALKWVYEDVPVDHSIAYITIKAKFADSVGIGSPTNITNTVYVDGVAGSDYNSHEDGDTESSSTTIHPVEAMAKITMNKSVLTPRVKEEEAASYKITITNNSQATGDLDLTGLGESFVITDTLPLEGANPIFKIGSLNNTTTADHSTITKDTTESASGIKKVVWSIDDLYLEPGESEVIEYNAIVEKGTTVGTYTNRAVGVVTDTVSTSSAALILGTTFSDTADVFVEFQGALKSVKGIGYNLSSSYDDNSLLDPEYSEPVVEDEFGQALVEGDDTYYRNASSNFAMPLGISIVNATVKGGVVRYRLEVLNNDSNGPLKNVVLIDKLPAVGDTGVIVSGQRNSEWSPYLISGISGDDNSALANNVYVYYSTKASPDLSQLDNTTITYNGVSHGGSGLDDWTTVLPDNITEVTHLKFEVADEIASTTTTDAAVVFEWDMRAPIDAPESTTDNPSIAWNSFAYAALYKEANESDGNNDGWEPYLPSEPIKVGVRIEPDDIIPIEYRSKIGDRVWLDKNYDGIQGVDEVGINNILVNLYEVVDGTVSAEPVDSTRTSVNDAGTESGLYVFPSLANTGKYVVEFVLPEEADGSLTYQVTKGNEGSDRALDSDISAAQNTTDLDNVFRTSVIDLDGATDDLTIDAGLFKYAEVGDKIWHDRDADGIQDSGEPGYSGLTVKLYIEGVVDPVGTTITEIDGSYLFTDLVPEDYYIVFEKPLDYFFSTKGTTGLSDLTDSDPDTSNGKTETFNLESEESDMTWDAGVWTYAKVGDRIWLDENRNGGQDVDVNGIHVEGAPSDITVTVNLLNSSGSIIETFIANDDNGYDYLFDELTPGNYKVEFVLPVDYSASAKDVSGDGNGSNETAENIQGSFDSDGNINTAFIDDKTVTDIITLYSGNEPMTYDQGIYQSFSLGDYVWFDMNGDGQQDDSESGLDDINVELYVNNTLVDSTTTDTKNSAAGYYEFTDLAIGSYFVKVTVPANYITTNLAPTANNQGDDVSDSDIDRTTFKSGTYTFDGSTLVSERHIPTVDAGFFQPADIGNFVWLDANFNGIQDVGETGVSGVVVTLKDSNDVTVDSSTTTNNGLYHFTGLFPDTYSIEFSIPNSYYLTTANAVTSTDANDSDAIGSAGSSIAVISNVKVINGQTDLTNDIGLYQKVALGNYVWLDTDYDGIQDSDEHGLEGITVSVHNADHSLVDGQAAVITDDQGAYSFTGLNPGSYYIKFSNLRDTYDFIVTHSNEGGDTTKDSNGLRGSDGLLDETTTSTVTLASGTIDDTLDLGLFAYASVGDQVWLDEDRDGMQDAGELGLDGITVTLYKDDVVLSDTVTANGGIYKFDELMQGNYKVSFTIPDAYAVSEKDAGSDDANDSDGTPNLGLIHTNAVTDTFMLKPTENPKIYDLGIYETFSLGDLVWQDRNSNGIQELGEEGIEGIEVKLYSSDGVELLSDTTDVNGVYGFENLPTGDYYVVVVPTGAYEITPANAGGDDLKDSDVALVGHVLRTVTFTLAGDDDEEDLSIDAGLFRRAGLGDYVWEDLNYNGLQDDGNTGIEDVLVKLLDSNDNYVVVDGKDYVLTDTNGYYFFPELIPGTYTVQFTFDDVYTLTGLNSGDDAADSDATYVSEGVGKITAISHSVTLIDNETNESVDMGLYKKASIGDYVWLDADYDGVQDIEESGIEGITVTLHKASDHSQIGGSKKTLSDGSYLFEDLDPGTYYVKFSGIRDDEDYIVTARDASDEATDSDGEAGVFTSTQAPNVTITSGEALENIDLGLFAYASVGDRVWLDIDRNGQQDIGEVGVEDVSVKLLKDDVVIKTTTTDAEGDYLFDELMQGNYKVAIVIPDGYSLTPSNVGDDNSDSDGSANNLYQDSEATTNGFTLVPTNEPVLYDFGLYESFSLGDYSWVDENGNSRQDSTENGLDGVIIGLYATPDSDTPIETTTTITKDGLAGYYIFDDLAMGSYYVKVTEPYGYLITYKDQVEDDNDSDVHRTTNSTDVYTFDATTTSIHNPTVDVGFYRSAGLGNYVWEDIDYDGIQDDNELGISGIKVTLKDSEGEAVQADGIDYLITDTDGYYHFSELNPGTYSIEFELPEDYYLTKSNVLDDDEVDSDALFLGDSRTTAIVEEIILLENESDFSIDLGLYQMVSLGDYVWYDTDKDGLQDEEELPAVGVEVQLFGEDIDIERTTTTDDHGYYLFEELPPGTYEINFEFFGDYHYTVQGSGSDDALDSDPSYSGILKHIELIDGVDERHVDAGLVEKTTRTDKDKETEDDVETPEEPIEESEEVEEPVVEPEKEPILEEVEPLVFVKVDPPKDDEEVDEEDKPKEIIYKPSKKLKEIKVSKEPEEGTIEIIDGLIVYSPGPDFDGSDSVTLSLVREDGEEEEFILEITDEIPEGVPELPRTSGIPTDIFIGFGSLLICAGLWTKKK